MAKLIFAALILVVALMGYFYCKRAAVKEAVKPKTGRDYDESNLNLMAWGKRISLGLLIIPFLVVILSTLRVVPAGHVGVPVLFGKVQMKALPEGLNIVNPLFEIVKMDCRVQKYEDKYDAASKDLQNVHVTMALNFRVFSDKAPEIYQKVGPEFKARIIMPAAQEILKANTALHNVGEILMKRPEIKNDVQQGLAKWLLKYNIELKEVSLVNIAFDKEYEKAIVAKQVEEQRAEQKKYMLIQAQKDAEIMAASAKGKGDAAREEAKGVADALKIKGEAENNYNQKVS
ncbi:MAG: prohibitin family protein, partial [bacterium]|nr:prohibitin family protein [bacterium]